MAKQLYEAYKPKPDAALVISRMNMVIGEYIQAGYKLTVRQLYYQMIARDLFPDTWIDPIHGTKNNVKNYQKLGIILGKARMGGMTDWKAIEDRGRNLETVSSWDNPQQIMTAVGQQYRIDLWATQPYHIQVWVEKDALSGVLDRVCTPLRVPWMACKGYMSLSEMRAQGLLLAAQAKDICIIHLGDHDPSGIAMTHDVEDRLSVFAERPIEVVRIALNMDQIEEFNPPENPAKESDPRFAAYEREFGDMSWELDALQPQTLAELITNAVTERLDQELWDEAMESEKHEKSLLASAAENWDSVVSHLEDSGLVDQDDSDEESDDNED